MSQADLDGAFREICVAMRELHTAARALVTELECRNEATLARAIRAEQQREAAMAREAAARAECERLAAIVALPPQGG